MEEHFKLKGLTPRELESYTNNANKVKDAVLDRLLKDKIINDAYAQEYSEKWQIIIFKRSWFKQWMDKFSEDKEDKYQYKLVRFED